MPTVSFVGAAFSQDLDSDLDQYSYLTSPAHLIEEEGKVSDQDTSMPEPVQQLSDEQNYQETI